MGRDGKEKPSMLMSLWTDQPIHNGDFVVWSSRTKEQRVERAPMVGTFENLAK